MNHIMEKLKNSYAKEFEPTDEDYAYLSRENAIKILDWLISSVKKECSREQAAEIFARTGYDLADYDVDFEYHRDDAIILYTYPSNKDFFCKKFEVEEGYLIHTLCDIDKINTLNTREGEELSNFLQNYKYGETQLIYEKAKKENKLISDEDLKITREMVCKGLSSGYIQLINCPQSNAETVCQINGSWFYFGGHTAEGLLPEEYKKVVPFEDIVNEIFNTLEDFRESDWDEYKDEYAMYECYLRSIYESEMFVVKTLQNEGIDFYHHPNSLSYEFG